MSTLSSWIDPKEINELLPFLLPKEEPAGKPDADPPPEVVGLPEEPVAAEPTPEPVGGEGEGETESETSEMASPESEPTPRIDFDSPEAYDQVAFPEFGDDSDDGTGRPSRQAAAVQAASALERARDRANQGGLLRSAMREEETSVQAEQEAAPPEEALVESVRDASPPASEAIDEGELPAPGTLRFRLAEFARFARELAGGSDLVITDTESYPLYPAANGASHARITASVRKLDESVSQLPGGNGAFSQVGLSDATWLCLLTQESASGGICVRLRVPEPISTEKAAELKSGLRHALSGTAA